MRNFAARIVNFLRRYKHELFFFWRYAIRSKLHFIKYSSRKVIMFRLDLIGDCAMFTSAAKAIREYYSDREMTIVCLSVSKPIFERLGIFDKIITVNFKPEAIRWDIVSDLIKEIRISAYDLLLQPQISKFPLVDVLAAAVRCNRRISIEPFARYGNSPPRWIKMTNFLYDQFIQYPRGDVSEFDYYGAFIRGACDESYCTTKPCLPYGGQHVCETPYYVIFPGASLVRKIWSLDRYAEVVEYVYRKTKLSCVVIATEGERWAVEDLKYHMQQETLSTLVDLTGKTSISDVIDVIGNAEFIISNDTSGVHIAAATNTPSIACAGGWHHKRFLPYHIEDVKSGDRLPMVACTELACYGCKWDPEIMQKINPDCLQHLYAGIQVDCICAVSVRQVTELVDRIIEEMHLDYSDNNNFAERNYFNEL